MVNGRFGSQVALGFNRNYSALTSGSVNGFDQRNGMTAIG